MGKRIEMLFFNSLTFNELQVRFGNAFLNIGGRIAECGFWNVPRRTLDFGLRIAECGFLECGMFYVEHS
jgi:hypothetical protein